MRRISRRKLLAASAAGTGIGLAGCMGTDDDPEMNGDAEDPDSEDEESSSDENGTESSTDSDDSEDEPPEQTDDAEEGPADSSGDSTPTLLYVDVENRHEDSHTAHVIVEDGEELVHWSDLSLEPGETEEVDRTWDVEPGSYVVSMRIDDEDEWAQIDLTHENSICYGVVPRITDDGEINILFESNPAGCEDAEDD